MAGHVFITRGDLTQLHCDAWLMPTDVRFTIGHGWRKDLPKVWTHHLDGLRHGVLPFPENWGNADNRVLPVGDDEPIPQRPHPYLVNVGAWPGIDTDWYLEGARQFFRIIAEHLAGGWTVSGRSKPLVGLPLIGVGHGSAGDIKGDIVLHLVAELFSAAETFDFDVALVLNNQAAFIAAQNARRRIRRQAAALQQLDLDAGLVSHAQRLAEHAAAGRLVLFIGAGVSRSAGLPNWDGLLRQLAADAEMTTEEQAALDQLHHLDRARIIETRLQEKGVRLGRAISDHLTAQHYSLAHSLLASLPASEVVTTNYDCLFEEASSSAGRPAAVLPYQTVVGHDRWLLKLHGSVTHPDDIVLTREDYLRYADRRAALAGIVQALLITRHMLFVGFSLTDDHFQRIVDDVRKVITTVDHPGAVSGPFGTALLLRADPLLEELWRNDLNLVGMSETGGHAARQLEILLDTLLAEASSGTSPLLDPAYDGLLTPEEREIRDLLKLMENCASSSAKQSPSWRPIAELFGKLGEP
jgi:hypothetical protein